MKEVNSKKFHKLYGVKNTRIAYQKKDFLDYSIMAVTCALVVRFTYGIDNIMSISGIILCILMIVIFSIRHGVEIKTPVIAQRPQDILYMFIYRLQNIKPMYILAISLLLLENYLIYLTPNLPHNIDLTHQIAIYIFYAHFILISLYRTVILVSHLQNREHIREVLMQTSWKRAILRQPNMTLEIFHAYFTGILSHMILIVPWYLVITYFNFSIIFLPVICMVNLIMHYHFLQVINAWFYRDHWLCHNSELEFLYLHGPHHDAIPSGLIGVSGNGHLEGLIRHAMGSPAPFYNPIITFLVYGFEVKSDMDGHQFIPGVFPQSSLQFQEINQHSIHHFGHLEPYGFGIKVEQLNVSEDTRQGLKMFPDELQNSIRLDEQLTGFIWENPRHKQHLNLFEKYLK